MIRWTAAPALVVALIGLAACSSASTTSSTSPPSSASIPAAVASTPTAATGIPASLSPSTSTAPAPDGAGAYPAADVCTYLQGQIPVLTAIGSPVGREANLAANLFTFFSDHGIAPDGTQLDAATKTQCPDVRSQLLTLTGLTSLAEL